MIRLLRLSALFSVAAVVCTAIAPLSIQAQDAFITTWETTSDGESITIPTESSTSNYDFEIDWGDGTTDQITGDDPDPSHEYGQAGTHTIEITGTFPRIFLNDTGDEDPNSDKLQSIDQWGNIQWESMEDAFAGASNLTYNASDKPDLSNMTSMRAMFSDAASFNGDIGDWNVSNITDMSYMFFDVKSFNQDIGGWDTGNVTNMEGMFGGFETTTDFNQDISEWDVSNVTDMSSMFQDAKNFNQDISGWDVSNVTDMSLMFVDATAFNQDIGGWNVSNVTNMRRMFSGLDTTTDFDQDIGSWDVSSVTDMEFMFDNTALSTTNYDRILSGWATRDLKDGVSLGADGTQYCNSGPSRTHLIEAFDWTINDAGQQSGCPNDLGGSDAKQVASDGTESFAGTGTEVTFSGVTDGGRVTISKYSDKPSNVQQGTPKSGRLVVAGGGLSFDSAELRVDVSEFSDISNPEQIEIFRREQPGGGTFKSIPTEYDSEADELVGSTDSFSEFAFANESDPLPVELANFNGTVTGSSARLTWQTASETNNAGFEVQRRKEREGWTEIGYVESKAEGGTTTETKSYSYTATSLPVGTHQFRLKQVDLDGSTTLHGPIAVEVKMREPMKLSAPSPNPTSNSAALSFAVKKQSETTIRLYNTLGQQVSTVYEGIPQPGEQQTARIDASNLPSGTYFLRLETADHTETEQLTVVR